MLDSFFASEIVCTYQWNQQKFHIWTWKSLRKEGISFCVHIDNCHWLTGTGRYKHMRDDFVHFLPFLPFSDSGSLKPASSLVFLRTVSRFFTPVIQLSNYLPSFLPYIIHTPFHLSIHSGTHLYIHHVHLFMYLSTLPLMYLLSHPSFIHLYLHLPSTS